MTCLRSGTISAVAPGEDRIRADRFTEGMRTMELAAMLSGPGYAHCRTRLAAGAENITINSPETQGFQAVSAWRAREESNPRPAD